MADDEPALYRARPEWRDVTPVPQADIDEPICPIVYTERFADTMDYFRAVVRADERSARALALTADVIAQNPANYTAWQFRRLCLYALESDLADELDTFVYELSSDNPKNYQMWHHRRACAERLSAAAADEPSRAPVCERELKFCHKQWAVQHFGAWADEPAFVDELLADDVRNNSAWNHRFFVVTQRPEPPTRRAEAQYTLAAIGKAPNNESPWSYLRGVLLSRKAARLVDADDADRAALVDEVEQECRAIEKRAPACAHCIVLQLDIAEQRAEQAADSESRKTLLSGAQVLCDVLETKRDPLHANYWKYRKNKLLERIEQVA